MPRWLYHLGTFSARHRLALFIAWPLDLLVVGVVTLTGMKSSDAGLEIPGQESSTALSIVEDTFAARAGAPATSSLQLVVQSADGITTGDGPATVERLVQEAGVLPHVAAVSDPLQTRSPKTSGSPSGTYSSIARSATVVCMALQDRRRWSG